MPLIQFDITPARTPIPDPELSGVFDRAIELFHQLREEYLRTQSQPDVTERAKNLFHEILVKVRSSLDMTWYRVWDKHGRPNWTKPKEPHVYFPIRDLQKDFDDEIQHQKKGLKLDLMADAPAIYDYVRSIQPFVTQQPGWSDVRDLSNLGKHVRLSKQTRELLHARLFKTPDGGSIIWTKGGRFEGGPLHGVPIDPATGEPESGVEDTIEVNFYYEVNGKRKTLPDFFCCVVIQSAERVVSKILTLL